MPEEFDNMRRKIKYSLKASNPNLSEEELESRSYAIAVSNWQKSHSGQSPFK